MLGVSLARKKGEGAGGGVAQDAKSYYDPPERG